MRFLAPCRFGRGAAGGAGLRMRIGPGDVPTWRTMAARCSCCSCAGLPVVRPSGLYLCPAPSPSSPLPALPLPRLARAPTFIPRRGLHHAFFLLRPGRSSPFFYRPEQAVASLLTLRSFLSSSSRTIPHSLDAVAQSLTVKKTATCPSPLLLSIIHCSSSLHPGEGRGTETRRPTQTYIIIGSTIGSTLNPRSTQR